jgi:hypothetical protein
LLLFPPNPFCRRHEIRYFWANRPISLPKAIRSLPALLSYDPQLQLVEKLWSPTPVNDGKSSSPSEIFPIRESHLLAEHYMAAWRDGLPMTLPYDLETHSSLANAKNNIKNEWRVQGIGETIGVIEHSDIEGPESAE